MKISIIVPVYNAERYLDKLVQSVLSQTYEDYELILVDDSSKDNSYSLMKKYQEMDSRIKAYTKENTGPGLTRKFGFEKSSGDLFFFVDSDDWITTSDVLREINDLFEKNQKIDVLFFDREDIIGDMKDIISGFNETREGLHNIDELNEVVRPGLGAKIFRKSILTEEMFYESTIFEDLYTTYIYLDKCNNYFYSSKCYYTIYHDVDSSSLSSKPTAKAEGLMEKFFEQDSLSEDEMREGIRKGLVARGMFPVFCVCGGKDMGVRRLMEFLGNVVPFVSEMPKVQNTEGKEVAPDVNGPESLYFFKTSVEPHIGEVSYFKVMSGKVREGDDLLNADRGSKERIAQIYVVAGGNRVKVEELQAGDIGAAVKLKDVKTGNTLNGKDCDYKFNFIKYPNSKYSRAIKPVNEADVEKMMTILNRMREEDPTWVIEQSKELKQTLVHGQGEFHLRTLKWRLENNEKLQVKYEEPKIPYRETITKAARADYRHKKQSGGAGQFGEVHLIVEPYKEGMPVPDTYKFNGQEFKINVKGTEEVPLEWGGKLVFVNSIVGGSIDARFLPAILKGIMARMEQGPLTGSYARDVRVIVYDGKMHPVDSNEISFMLAGRNAFSEAFKNAGPKILEPIYDVEVFVPSDKMGDVMGDLQGRRAMIMGMSSEKGFEKLVAKVPLKEMSSYSTALSSLTGGRASFIMKFSSYELVPTDVQDKLIKDFEAKQTEE